jgi:hypothetical protein
MNYFIVSYNLFNMILLVSCLYINFQLHIFPIMMIPSYNCILSYYLLIIEPLLFFTLHNIKLLYLLNIYIKKFFKLTILLTKYYRNTVDNQKSYILHFYT